MFELIKMKKLDGTYIAGLAFLLLWISHVPYLFTFPLCSTPGIQSLAKEASEVPEWIKKEAGFEGKKKNDIEADLVAAFRVTFAKSFIICLLGITSGVLLLKRKKTGRFLAIGLSGCFLAIKLFTLLSSENLSQELYAKYTMFFPKYPFRVLHLDILTNIVLLAVLVYLLRPSVGKHFSNPEDLKT